MRWRKVHAWRDGGGTLCGRRQGTLLAEIVQPDCKVCVKADRALIRRGLERAARDRRKVFRKMGREPIRIHGAAQ